MLGTISRDPRGAFFQLYSSCKAELGLRDTAEFTHMALGLVPKVFDTVDVIISVGKKLEMVDAKMTGRRGIAMDTSPSDKLEARLMGSDWNLVIVQPLVPAYRNDFFNRLDAALEGHFVVHGSDESLEGLPATKYYPWHNILPKIIGPVLGVEWQPRALGIPLGKSDVLVVCGAPRTVSTLFLLVRARVKGVRTIWWGQFWSATSKNWRFRLRLQFMRLADAILFYTDEEVVEYRAAQGADDKRLVSALNNGIDVEPVQRQRLPYDAEKRGSSILFIGRLTQKAKISLLLDALADDRLGEVTLHVIGSGLAAGEFKAKADKLGISLRTIWHGATIDEAKIASIANTCRIFVYPGQVGLSLIHAMAYGLPAIVHSDRKTHMPEFAAFSEGLTGWSFEPGDSRSLADRIFNALYNIDDLNRASALATARADTTYNTRVMAERMLALVDLLRKPARE